MSMVPLVSSAEELPEALRYATLHPSSRWYVAARARMFGQPEAIPAEWGVPEPVVAAVVEATGEEQSVEPPVDDDLIASAETDQDEAEYRRGLGLTANAAPEIVALVAAASITQAERDEGAKNGDALPDGSYLIRNKHDLHSAIVLRGKGDSPQHEIYAHIRKRAKALGATDMLPDELKTEPTTASAVLPNVTFTGGNISTILPSTSTAIDTATVTLTDCAIVADASDDTTPDQVESEPEPVVAAAKISDKPWSDFSDSDYTPEQYKHACLVAKGDTKADCHLPVREPDGTLNHNGVHAAAAALAGARGGVNLSPQQRKVAIRKLKSLYHQLGEDLPDSLTAAVIGVDNGADFDDTLHPRGHDGKFITNNGRVDVTIPGGATAPGTVSGISQDAAGVHVQVRLDNGDVVTAAPAQIAQAPVAVARIKPTGLQKQALAARVRKTDARPVPVGHPQVPTHPSDHPLHGVAQSMSNKGKGQAGTDQHARVDAILHEPNHETARQHLEAMMSEAKLSGHQRTRHRALLNAHHAATQTDHQLAADVRRFPAGTLEGDSVRAEQAKRDAARPAPTAAFDRPGHGRPLEGIDQGQSHLTAEQSRHERASVAARKNSGKSARVPDGDSDDKAQTELPAAHSSLMSGVLEKYQKQLADAQKRNTEAGTAQERAQARSEIDRLEKAIARIQGRLGGAK